jgi:hypothetical protein
VSDLQRARSWYLDVLGADLYGEYGGASVVLSFLGAWLLLVTAAGPTEDKPTVTMTEPTDPDRIDHAFNTASGGGRIRTCVGYAGDFTDRSLWPLGHPPGSTSRLAHPLLG